MKDFNLFIESLETGLTDIARLTVKDCIDSAIEDGKSILVEMKSDLERWTVELTDGNLPEDEFQFLVESKKDLLKLEALKQSGLTKIQIDSFRDAVVGLVLDSAFKIFL